MKSFPCALLIFISLLTACAPQGAATPLPKLTSTNTPPPTTTPEPTQTPIPTPAPVIHADKIPLDACPQIVDVHVTDTGVLQIIYTDSSDTRLWFWGEDIQKAVSFPLPSDAFGAKLSTDRHQLIYRRDLGDDTSGLLLVDPAGRADQSEIWVVDADGQSERKLATVSFSEIKTRHPNIEYATLEYGWVPHTNKIYYTVEIDGPRIGALPPIYDTFVLIDIHSGKPIPLVEAGTANNVKIAPDGSQAAVLTADTLRLIDTENGNVQFALPSQIRNDLNGWSFKNLAYSPDSQHVIGFSDDGIFSVNAKDGASKTIPLSYTILRGSLPASPSFTWVNNSTIIVPVTNLPEGVQEIIEPWDFPKDADANFTLWRVNLLDAIAEPVQTFRGFGSSAVFSPDGNFILFDGRGQYGTSPNGKFAALQKPGKLLAGPPPNLVLADLNTGEILATHDLTIFLGWSSNSKLYMYSQPEDLDKGIYPVILYLGQVGKEPIRLGRIEQPLYFRWVDEARFVIKNGCEIMDWKFSP